MLRRSKRPAEQSAVFSVYVIFIFKFPIATMTREKAAESSLAISMQRRNRWFRSLCFGVLGPTDGQSERERVKERQTKLKRLHDINLNLDNSVGRMRCEALVALAVIAPNTSNIYIERSSRERSDIIVKNYIKIISRKRRSRLENT